MLRRQSPAPDLHCDLSATIHRYVESWKQGSRNDDRAGAHDHGAGPQWVARVFPYRPVPDAAVRVDRAAVITTIAVAWTFVAVDFFVWMVVMSVVMMKVIGRDEQRLRSLTI
jgi:hypothetical protein